MINKTKISVFLFFLFLGTVYSQNNFEATYKVDFKEINYDSIMKSKGGEKKYNIDLYKNAIKRDEKMFSDISKKAVFTLNYNSLSAEFFMEELLSQNQRTIRGFRIRTGVFGKYYSNKDVTLEAKNSYGKNFIVKYRKYNWEITNVSKKIGDYTCYKAVSVKVFETSKGGYKQKITAWFTPEIPFNYGPKDYNGLPGLIVELQNDRLRFRLTKIKKVKFKEIKKPTKGKEITFKDFNILGKKMVESLKSKN